MSNPYLVDSPTDLGIGDFAGEAPDVVQEIEKRESWECEVDRLVSEGGADPYVYDVASNRSRLRKVGLSPQEAARGLIHIYFSEE